MEFRSEVIFKREQKDVAKEMLYRLLAGIAVFGVIIEIVLLLLCDNDMAVTLGLLLGLWIAFVNSVYIFHSLEKALAMDEKNSVKAMRGPVVVRYCFMGAAVAIALLNPEIFSPVATILGLLSMKLSAYIQPFFMESNPDAKPVIADDDEEEEESFWDFGISEKREEDGRLKKKQPDELSEFRE